MTQVVLIQRQTLDPPSVLIGSEAKNPLPICSHISWKEISGLSWLVIENPENYGNEEI